jgi:hypothetical protein
MSCWMLSLDKIVQRDGQRWVGSRTGGFGTEGPYEEASLLGMDRWAGRFLEAEMDKSRSDAETRERESLESRLWLLQKELEWERNPLWFKIAPQYRTQPYLQRSAPGFFDLPSVDPYPYP